MLSKFQLQWGIDQWVAFLKDKEIPVLQETVMRLNGTEADGKDHLAPKELASVVMRDPFLALKILRRAEGRRSQTLGQETTTALAAVLHAGVDDFTLTVRNSTLADAALIGMMDCVSRTVLAAKISSAWASLRADVSSEEVSLSALLAESGELLLWHFAPELPQKALDELVSGRALRTLQAQQQAIGFSFKQMSMALSEAWALPALLTQLIRGSDTPRANIARLAGDTARHIIVHPENPALPADLVNIKNIIPGASYESLVAPLPVSPEYQGFVLQAVAKGSY